MKKIVVKLSGKTLNSEDLLLSLLKQIAENRDKAHFYIIHGGGVQITSLYQQLGIETRFVEGLRYTTKEMMNIVEMVLSGVVNKKIVSMLLSLGVDAIGVSGRDNIFTAKDIKINGKDVGLVGEVVKTNVDKLEQLSQNGQVVVISPVSNDENFEPLNINADNGAEKLAIDIKADDLLLVSDVEGLLDKDKNIIKNLSKESSEALISDGTITDGMIVKIRSTFNVIDGGVKRVVITNIKENLIENLITNNPFNATIIK